MQNVTSHVLHYFLIIIGLFFLFTAIFTYEDINKKVQNKLADIYLDIQIIKEKYSTIRALMIKANEIVLNFFKLYFDDGKLTLNFIGISGILYICFAGYMVTVFSLNDAIDFEKFLSQPQYLFYCTFLIVLVFLFFKKLNMRYPIYFLVVVLALVYTIIDGFRSDGLDSMLETPACFIISIFCIKLNIVVTKWNIKNLINKKSYLLIIPLLVAGIIVICGIMFGTTLILGAIDPDFLGRVAILLSFFPAFLLIAITDGAFIVLFLAIVANKIIFPIVAEPIRALYEHKLIKNKKILAAIGFLFLFIAFPQFMDNPLVMKVKDIFK